MEKVQSGTLHQENYTSVSVGQDRKAYDAAVKPVIVQNILSTFSRSELLEDVKAFAAQKGLEDHLEDLQKGALVAQHPTRFESIPELTSEDKQVISYEATHRWR